MTDEEIRAELLQIKEMTGADKIILHWTAREGFVDTWYGLALVATRQGCSRTTRIVGDDHCETLILSATPERCLA